MGTPPPRDPANDAIKRELWAISNEKKAFIPDANIQRIVDNDQFGAQCVDFEECNNRLSCCVCGEPFALGAGFVFDKSYDNAWCEPCFREMAYEKYGLR